MDQSLCCSRSGNMLIQHLWKAHRGLWPHCLGTLGGGHGFFREHPGGPVTLSQDPQPPPSRRWADWTFQGWSPVDFVCLDKICSEQRSSLRPVRSGCLPIGMAEAGVLQHLSSVLEPWCTCNPQLLSIFQFSSVQLLSRV